MSDRLISTEFRTGKSLVTQNRMSPMRALIWKQCADLSMPFVVLTAGSLVVFCFTAWATRNRHEPDSGLLFAAGLFAAIFALAACFVSFVTESERRTREFLGNLPVSSFQVGGAKLLVAVLAVIVFFTVQIGLAFAVAWLGSVLGDGGGLAAEMEFVFKYWGVAALATAVVFVSWLISCSFWSSSWMSVFCGFFLTWGLAVVCGLLGEFYFGASHYISEDSVRHHSLMVTLVGAVAFAIWLPLVWLRRKPLLPKRSATSAMIDHQEKDFWTATLPAKLGIPTPAWLAMPSRGRFPALCWQSVRQQMMLPFLAVATGATFVLLLKMALIGGVPEIAAEPFALALMFLSTMTGFGFGMACIYRDKLDSNLNFFQQHQEHGRELLLARILFPLSLLIVSVALTNLVIYLLTGCWSSIWLPLLSGFAAFSVTLMWSMALGSFVYALGVGLVLSIAMNGFLASMAEEQGGLGHPWIAALPIVWLATCFAYAPVWLSGRRSFAWIVWFVFVSLAMFAVPLWMLMCWMLGVEVSATGF